MEKGLSFSLYDFISTVIPGICFLLIVYLTQPTLNKLPPELIGIGTFAFGFVVGLIFLGIGNLLFGVFIHPKNFKGTFWYWPILVLHKMIKTIIGQDYALKGLDIREPMKKVWLKKLRVECLDSLSLYQLSDILVHQHGRTDRDDLLAKEGAFRSLTSLTIFTAIYLRLLGSFGIPNWLWLIVVTAILRLFLYGHNYYQKIRQSQVYLSAYLLLKGVKV